MNLVNQLRALHGKQPLHPALLRYKPIVCMCTIFMKLITEILTGIFRGGVATYVCYIQGDPEGNCHYNLVIN